MTGFLGFAPIYVNGLLAIFFIFVLPGLVLVRGFDIPDFPQRWFVVFLSSVTFNHLLVTLIALLQLDPLTTYRIAALALVGFLIFATVRKAAGSGSLFHQDRSVMLRSDIGWLLASLVIISLAYFNIWKHGVPNIFAASDVAVSWNVWSLIWSEGKFPVHSYGYPHFVPTLWAVTYIFIGSTEQYFAFYTYIVLIIAPPALNAMMLGRIRWWQPLLAGLVFIWFVAEIQEPWLRSTLQEGWPDWIAAFLSFSGAVLFVANAPEGRIDRQQAVNALVAICLVSIAAATKPIYGLLAIAILIATCRDVARHLPRHQRNRLIAAAVGVLAIFVVAYAITFAHLLTRGMPHYPVVELSERLSRAARLLNSNFTLPFRILIGAGLLLCPFLPRIRWLALPLAIGFWLWANTASYDVRNILGLLATSAFIPLYALAGAFMPARDFPTEPRWSVPDGAIAAVLAVLCVGLTLPLAQGDKELKQRFADQQLRSGTGLEFNEIIAKLLDRGCTVFSADVYIGTVSAFRPFRSQMKIFHFSVPLDDRWVKQFNESTGCTGIFYRPGDTHPSLRHFIAGYAQARGLQKLAEGKGFELLGSAP